MKSVVKQQGLKLKRNSEFLQTKSLNQINIFLNNLSSVNSTDTRYRNQPRDMTLIQKSLVILVVVAMLLGQADCYLQFKLERIPRETKKLKEQQFRCPQSLSTISDQDYKQVCYDKDISYSFQISKDGSSYMISADLTTPISWFKGKQCIIKDTDKKCTLIQNSLGDKISEYTHQIKKKLKRHSKGDKSEGSENRKVQIYGSSNVVQGFLQQPPHMAFEIMDSNRLTRLVDIMLLGMFVLGEKDNLELQSTRFINATTLTEKLSYASDGAISLRFDQNSQNSFLNEIFSYTKAQQKIATLYLGENNYLAIGELSLKFSEHGYSGINWVGIQQDQYFGKVPTVTDLIVEDTERQIDKKMLIQKPAILTLSASYIGMHSVLVERLSGKLSRSARCGFEEHGYLKCTYGKNSDRDRDLSKSLTFSFGESSISLPLKDLLLHSQSQLFILNIKQLYQQDYLILGQPVFKKYTLYLDYGKQRLGFAIRRQHFQKQFINVVSLIRFLVIVFCAGCCFILCSAPCRVVCNWCFGSKKVARKRLPGDKLRLKQYSPIQSNAYDEISQRVRTITTTQQSTQVDDGQPEDSI